MDSRFNPDQWLLKHECTRIIDLNIRAKALRLLEENVEVNLHDLELGNGFLVVTPKHRQ